MRHQLAPALPATKVMMIISCNWYPRCQHIPVTLLPCLFVLPQNPSFQCTGSFFSPTNKAAPINKPIWTIKGYKLCRICNSSSFRVKFEVSISRLPIIGSLILSGTRETFTRGPEITYADGPIFSDVHDVKLSRNHQRNSSRSIYQK